MSKIVNLFGDCGLGMDPALTLEGLKTQCLSCRQCGLRDGCQQVVFGEGDPHAKIMFVGEGPGAHEDIQGRPFVGAAGKLLDRILAAIELKREQVYIANVVKCRPPQNRQPTPQEAQTCLTYLQQQVALIRPRFLVCLGAAATQTLIDPNARITKIRGQWVRMGDILVMPTFHPAALLRDPSKKPLVWEDVQKLQAEYRKEFA